MPNMTEPNCDMPWEVYLDWLQDQGNEDLRDINIFSLISVNFPNFIYGNSGLGDGCVNYTLNRRLHGLYDMVGYCVGCYRDYMGDGDGDGSRTTGDGFRLGSIGAGNGNYARA